jgi:Mg2+ and Co2+ transporter CorA
MQDRQFVAELEQVAGKALPAMQFHDISNQLLAHIQDRFDTFLSELERLSRGLRSATGTSKAKEMARQLGEMRTTLAENMAALDRRLRKPVARDDMASGEVELF